MSDLKGDRKRAAWMQAAQAGDRAAYLALLCECIPYIRRSVRSCGVLDAAIDDVAQDVLLTIHRVRHTFDATRSFDAWLAAIVRRRVIDALRREHRLRTHELHVPLAHEYETEHNADPAGLKDGEAFARALRDAISTLPPAQREAVETLSLAERPLREAAAITGRKEGALKANLHRAIKALRTRFAR